MMRRSMFLLGLAPFAQFLKELKAQPDHPLNNLPRGARRGRKLAEGFRSLTANELAALKDRAKLSTCKGWKASKKNKPKGKSHRKPRHPSAFAEFVAETSPDVSWMPVKERMQLIGKMWKKRNETAAEMQAELTELEMEDRKLTEEIAKANAAAFDEEYPPSIPRQRQLPN